MRDREKYEAMDYIKFIVLWCYTAPFCSCTEQHLLSVSCASVYEETFCPTSTASAQTKQTLH